MNENETIEVITKLEWEDYKRVQKVNLLKLTFFKILFALSLLAILFNIIVSLWACKLDLACYIYLFESIKTPSILAFILFTCFSIPLVILFIFATSHITAKKYFDSNKTIQQEIKKLFSIEGIKSEASTFSGFIKWADIYEIKEYKEDLLILISTLESYIIPKRFFKSSEDLERVKEIIKQKVDPKKLKLLKNKNINKK